MAKDKKKRGQRKKKKRDRTAASRWYAPQALAAKADDGFLALARGLGVASRYVGDGATSTVAGAGRMLGVKKDGSTVELPVGEEIEGSVSVEEPADRVDAQEELVRGWEDDAALDLPEAPQISSDAFEISDQLESLANLADDEQWNSDAQVWPSRAETITSDRAFDLPLPAQADQADEPSDDDSAPKRRWWDEWREDEVPRYLKSNIEDAQWIVEDEARDDAAPASEADDILQALDEADYFEESDRVEAAAHGADDDVDEYDVGYRDAGSAHMEDSEYGAVDVTGVFDSRSDGESAPLPDWAADSFGTEPQPPTPVLADASAGLSADGGPSTQPAATARSGRRAISVHTLMRRYPAKNKVESIRLRAAVDDLLNGSEQAKSRALGVLASRGAAAAPFLVAALTTASNPVAREAIEWLVEVLDTDQLPTLLVDLLSARNVELRLLALPGIPRVQPAQAKALLMKASRDRAAIVRRRTISFLSWQQSSWGMAEIRRLCDDIDLGVKMAALEALMKVRPSEARLMAQKVADTARSTQRRLALALLDRYDPTKQQARRETVSLATAAPAAAVPAPAVPAPAVPAAPAPPVAAAVASSPKPLIIERQRPTAEKAEQDVPRPEARVAAATPPPATAPAQVAAPAKATVKAAAKATPKATEVRGADRRTSPKRKKQADRRKATKARPRVKD